MKKIKWTIMSLAIIVSVCGAFATRPKFDCSQAQQYFLSGTTYMPAGAYQVDYTCTQGSGTCTYYTLNGGITYSPCYLGQYDACEGCTVKKPTAPAKQFLPTH
jgi:hypothetical protein